MVAEIPEEPQMFITAGLFGILIMVLVLPFFVKKIEENLEPFFFVMGALALTITKLWSKDIIILAFKSPVMIHGMPIGITQVVLIAGLVFLYFHKTIYRGIMGLLNKIGLRAFTFIIITLLGFISSLISVIVTAVILAELVAALPLSRRKKIEFTVITCFAVGLGAALTPVGEPLSTIAVSKLAGPPYHADFFFLFRLLGEYIGAGIIAIAAFGSYYISKGITIGKMEIPEYTETLRDIIMRAVKVYLFVAALEMLGHGFLPLVKWYFVKIPPSVLYWVNMISAVLDNATLTAAEIGPDLSLFQIKSALMGLLISGGMLIPGNIPNIVAAGRLKITMREWAKIGVPMGLVLMLAYFLVIHVI